jgi:hypothetical protein
LTSPKTLAATTVGKLHAQQITRSTTPFFFVQPDGDADVDLYIDEVVLFDAGQAR